MCNYFALHTHRCILYCLHQHAHRCIKLKGVILMSIYLTDKQVTAIKRKRGELNLSTVALGRELGLSRWTLDNIFKRNHRKVTPATYKKLSDWLINEYATDDIKDSTAVATQNK